MELVDNCVNYNCDPLPAYDSTINNCGTKNVNSGANTIWLFECGHLPTDPGDEDELNQMVDAGFATKLDNLKIGFGDPAEQTAEPGTSCGNTEVTTYDRTLTIVDRKVTSANNEFYNIAKKRDYNGFVIKECGTSGIDPRVSYVAGRVNMRAFRAFGDTNKTPQEFRALLSWSDIDEPVIADFTEAP